MGRYSIDLKETAKKDLRKIAKSGDKSSIRRIEKIFSELSEHPTFGIGDPEKLNIT